ncbi:MAG TPA: PAS domain-containing sensor histidine kinase [Caulobacteraceae bacterium]
MRGLLAAGYVLAALLTAVCVYLASRPPQSGPIGPASQSILLLLLANLALILGLAAVIGWRVVRLVGERRRDAGARLHLRFVSLFALAAVLPAIVVALFFGVLVTRGLESWFSSRVRTVVENSATVARSYVSEQTRTMYGDVLAMATDLNRAAPLFRQHPVSYGRILEGQAANRYFLAAYVVDSEGRVLASAEAPSAPPFVAPPPSTLKSAAGGDVVIRPFERADLMRALYKLGGYQDAYLYVARRFEKGILNHLRSTEGSLLAYREAEQNRGKIQSVFALTYLETVLLVLVGAVWLGLLAAGALSGPIARLVQAADRVAGGDLSARVAIGRDPEEIAVLSRAFNRMTGDLQAQQGALRTASIEAEARRQFIETVLSGVSAGVIGLDGEGRISACNRQALALLGLKGDATGVRLEQAAPELASVVTKARRSGAAEEELDLDRGGDVRRLRVRASGEPDGRLVLTFDDITRLMAAQRNAAWKDVARRIAHEIKNPLTPIQLSAERLRRKYRGQIQGDLETFDRCTDTIIRQVGDIGRMVDEFSAFARMPAPRFAPHEAGELLREAVFAARVAAPNIAVEVAEPVPHAEVMCDARMVGQALINVLKNAAESVAARMAQDGAPGRITASLMADESAVRFEVEDDGLGLPAADRERLTEPYVTTREKGTGLGLAIVKRILEDHGGELKLLDARGRRGALAVLSFPRVPTAETAARARAAVA